MEGRELVGYDISETKVDEIVKTARSNHRVEGFVRRKIADNLIREYPIPELLRVYSWFILTGREKIGRRPARKPTQKHRDTLLVGLAKRVSNLYHMNVVDNQAAFETSGSVPILGCTIAVAALFGFDIIVNPSHANKIYGNKFNLIKGLEGASFLLPDDSDY